MATTKDILDDAELAKSYITNSGMSDDYKRTYLKLINLTTTATNGISPEEKIQKMTEAIQLLAVTQGMSLCNIDSKIDEAVAKANKIQCKNCKAMKMAEDAEEQEEKRKWIEEYKQRAGIEDDKKEDNDSWENITWSTILKMLVSKPYLYILLCVMSVTPYGVQIIDKILSFYR